MKSGPEIPQWATGELAKMGKLTMKEILLLAYVACALTLWIFGDTFISPTTVALLVIGMMLVTRVITWAEMMQNKDAWNTYAWFATLVALADGLSRVGFIPWFATTVGSPPGRAHPQGPGGPPAGELPAPLPVRQRHRPRHRGASGAPGSGGRHPGHAGGAHGAPALPAAGHHGGDHSLRHGTQSGVLRLGLPAGAIYWKLGTIFGVVYMGAFFLLTVPWVMIR